MLMAPIPSSRIPWLTRASKPGIWPPPDHTALTRRPDPAEGDPHGETQIVCDIASDSDYEPWREGRSNAANHAMIALPLQMEEQSFGSLNVYAAEADAFDNEEIALLTELADDLAYGSRPCARASSTNRPSNSSNRSIHTWKNETQNYSPCTKSPAH